MANAAGIGEGKKGFRQGLKEALTLEDSKEHETSEAPTRAKVRQALAVALEYKESDGLPRIISSGMGDLARSIVAIAEESGTPVATDGPLAELLIQAGVGNYIPKESLRAVAEILCFLHRLDCTSAPKIEHK